LPRSFERFVALRYLTGVRGKAEGRSFVRFIIYVSVGGVAVGVAALLLALSIVRGFSTQIQEKIIGFGAHIQVENLQDAPLVGAADLRQRLSEFEEVIHIAPVVQEFALLRRSPEDVDGVAIWGTEAAPAYIERQLVDGAFIFDRDENGRAGVVVGNQLAQSLGIRVGDLVTVFSMRGIQAAAPETVPGGGGRPRLAQFYVAGIYETLLAQFDEVYVFTGIADARALFDYRDDHVSRFDLTLSNPEMAEPVARAIEEELGFPIMARTIFEVYRSLFAWVNLQRSIIPLVISVIVIVAAFNIVGTLLMIILEKTRDIGILGSMGASRKTLRRVFVWLGVLIGVVGTGIGAFLALALGLIQLRWGVIPLPAEAYYMRTAPVELSALDFVVVSVVALVLCLLAAYLPARVAARTEPIKAIRFR
jgi:lipoprotein-releasing system permease protein